MKRYVSARNRYQVSIMPICLDDMIAEDNAVRAIDAIVESMDIPSLGFKYSKTAETGRKPYNPVDMFKLYTYSYFNGIRSSRKIEKECHRNIEVMWLIDELKPDFKTIADFRKDNKKQIKSAFTKFSMICDELGLIGKEMIAVDGSKFRANNGRGAYYTKKKVDKILKNYEESAQKYLSLLEACDHEDTGNTPSINRQEIEEKLKKIKDKINEFEAIAKLVETDGEIYKTDPDAKLMKSNDGGCEISHNVQIAVENKNHLVVVVDVTSEAVDRAQLCNISLQAKKEFGLEEITVIADKGYYSAGEFAKCAENGIIPIVSKSEHLECAATMGYAKTQFKYDEKNDVYICPQGEILKQTKKKNPDSLYNRYVNKKACMSCPVKDQCTTDKKHGRMIVDAPYQRFADEVDKRTVENMQLYKQRQRLAEHPFGTIKRSLGFTYFLTRRTESVRAESLLHFLVYNMKRTINILGTRELTEVLQG